MDFSRYQHLVFERKANGVLLMTMNRPEFLNATNNRLHWELTQVWRDIGEDPETKVVVVTGEGRAFSAGGDLNEMTTDERQALRGLKEAAQLVYDMLNLDKPIISAINGVAVGAGLAVALLADISIASEKARFTDGHVRLGVPAGDHAVILWPLLMSMAKAKYYLLTCDFLDGKEAERIGLVSLCVPHEELMPKALEIADKLATGPQYAIQWTKKALNNWIRTFGPHFDYSLALEMLGFVLPDVKEGRAALLEKRAPTYPSTKMENLYYPS